MMEEDVAVGLRTLRDDVDCSRASASIVVEVRRILETKDASKGAMCATVAGQLVDEPGTWHMGEATQF